MGLTSKCAVSARIGLWRAKQRKTVYTETPLQRIKMTGRVCVRENDCVLPGGGAPAGMGLFGVIATTRKLC